MKPPREKIHSEKMFFYRKREDEARARLDTTDPALHQRLIDEADGWARLSDARRTIKIQMDEIANRTRSS